MNETLRKCSNGENHLMLLISINRSMSLKPNFTVRFECCAVEHPGLPNGHAKAKCFSLYRNIIAFNLVSQTILPTSVTMRSNWKQANSILTIKD